MSESSRIPSIEARRLPFLLVPVAVLALLPWWRHHDFLRDFYDYGLVIAGLGLLEQGQKPYVDFSTPIQAGFFGLSWLAEKLGGGTYLGLTRGGAALIVLMAAGLTGMLARVWSWWAAAMVALTVTVASASQHTIVWHNSLGVFFLALVVWAGAVAPVWRRQDWPWHALAAAGLVLGGMNKLNFHLVALAAAVAWALRAGLLRQSGWGRVLGTVGGWLVAGVMLPLVIELGWTGASLEVWRHNVISLAAAARADTLSEILRWEFLFTPIHDYYGPLLLPQVGLVGVGISLFAMLGCWPGRKQESRWNGDWLLLPMAVILVAAAGAAFLATNQEIAYLGLAGWLVLVVGLWLGFAPDLRRRWVFGVGLFMPVLLLGVAAWLSAWQGQRSQYGHSAAARSEYELVDPAGPTFAYLHGVHLPPEMVQTLTMMESWLPEVGADGLRPVFYGAGTEWMQRFLPGLRSKGQPLWVHWDTTYGPREIWDLVRWSESNLRQQVILAQLARDQWPLVLGPTLERYYRQDLFGAVTRRWFRISHTNEHYADSIMFADLAGGNVAALILRTEEQPVMVALPYGENRIMMGVMGGAGLLLVGAPTYRFGADAVLERAPHARAEAVHADFKVIVHGADPEDVRWSARVELPAGEQRVALPFMVDAMGRNLQLRVTVPGEFVGRVSAGYRNFNINHAIEAPTGAPRLRPGIAAGTLVTPELTERIFGAMSWRPQQLVVRGGQVEDGHLTLAAGGEVWFHSENMTGEMHGQLLAVNAGLGRPTVRVVWYKGGRLQITRQGQIPADRPFDFHVWCAEPGGWIGILVDPAEGAGDTRVVMTEARFEP